MNKYIEEFISNRKKECVSEDEIKLDKIVNSLKIGKKEYLKDHDGDPVEDFPYYDDKEFDYYRYTIGEASAEDIEELMKYVSEEDLPDDISKKKVSGWYRFASILCFVGCIGGIVAGAVEKSAVIAIVSVLGVLITCSQIMLLSMIEYNTRKDK